MKEGRKEGIDIKAQISGFTVSKRAKHRSLHVSVSQRWLDE
jgi:hypothetical protein